MFKIKRKTRSLEALHKRLAALGKSKVESGYFEESGIHPEAGIPFARLMDIHEYGYRGDYSEVPPRPVREHTLLEMGESPRFYFGNIGRYLAGKVELADYLNEIGSKVTGYAQSVFGNSSLLLPNSPLYAEDVGKDPNNPLVLDGYLMANWAYRDTSNRSIRYTLNYTG